MKPLLETRHHDGELLRARDLDAELDGEARRRALHVRAVHRTWGVALGFALEAADSGVAIGPGFGYDCRGREIVSPERRLVPLASLEEPADLVIGSACGIQFHWRQPGRACDDELVLARGYFKGGRAVALDESVRRWCRSRRFRLAAGITDGTLGRRINVSTAAGSFQATPLYFATLETDARLAATLELANETASGFQLVLRAPAQQWSDVTRNKPSARVHWVGAERLPACDLAWSDKEDR